MKFWRLVFLSLLVACMLGTGPGWAQQPKPGGTLRVAMPGDLTFFNANQGPAPGYFTFWVWNNIFNSLLTLTPPPELKIIPELAKSWEVLDEGKTYVFRDCLKTGPEACWQVDTFSGHLTGAQPPQNDMITSI